MALKVLAFWHNIKSLCSGTVNPVCVTENPVSGSVSILTPETLTCLCFWQKYSNWTQNRAATYDETHRLPDLIRGQNEKWFR